MNVLNVARHRLSTVLSSLWLNVYFDNMHIAQPVSPIWHPKQSHMTWLILQHKATNGASGSLKAPLIMSNRPQYFPGHKNRQCLINIPVQNSQGFLLLVIKYILVTSERQWERERTDVRNWRALCTESADTQQIVEAIRRTVRIALQPLICSRRLPLEGRHTLVESQTTSIGWRWWVVMRPGQYTPSLLLPTSSIDTLAGVSTEWTWNIWWNN